MSMIGTKTPDEVKDYSLDWSKDISTDIISISANSVWSVFPSGVSINSSSLAGNGTLVTVWLAGGVVGQVYQVKNQITTTSGRNLTKIFRVLVVGSNFL